MYNSFIALLCNKKNKILWYLIVYMWVLLQRVNNESVTNIIEPV